MRIWRLGILLMIMAGVLLTVGGADKLRERPRDPWVFRCVLDQRPRMVVIALHDSLWVAYDATHCAMYKAWRGDVKLDGAVYTTVHGPQPTVRGNAILNGFDGDWRITRGGKSIDVKPVWRGYRIVNDQVTLLYDFPLPEGPPIMVQEMVDVEEASTSQAKLVRRFEVKNNPAGTVVSVLVPQRHSNGEAVKWMAGGVEVEAPGDGDRVSINLNSNEPTVVTAVLTLPAKPIDENGGQK